MPSKKLKVQKKKQTDANGITKYAYMRGAKAVADEQFDVFSGRNQLRTWLGRTHYFHILKSCR